MYLLCKNGEDWGDWDAISAHAEKEILDAEAERLNIQEYERDHKAWLKGGKQGYVLLALDDPKRKGYRTYFVREVPDWPETDGV